MHTLQEAMMEYHKQLEKGAIQTAYRGLMNYVLKLRAHFKKQYPENFVSGGVYTGFMDMTYFAIVPEWLKQHNLKIAVVFLHKEFRFEAWLSGVNREVQAKYWKLIRESGWEACRLSVDPQKSDSILEYTLVQAPDFGDLEALTRQIEQGTVKFMAAVKDFLARQPAV